jgi:hypothetical protein
LVAIVGGALLLRGPAEGDPTRTGVSAPQVPSESEKSPEIQERTEPSEPAAVVPPSALALEAAPAPRENAAVADERAEQPRAAVKPRPRPAARSAAGPAAPRTAAATPTAGKKQDVLKAFSERR